MKKVLLAVSLLMLASTAQADRFFNILALLKDGRPSPSALATFKKYSSTAFKNQAGVEAVDKLGFSIVAAKENGLNSVLVKFLPLEDSIEIGFLRVPNKQIPLNRIAKRFDEENKEWIANYLPVADARQSVNELKASFEKLSIKAGAIEATPQLLRVDGGRFYGILSSLRLELKDLSAQQIQSLIEEAQALL